MEVQWASGDARELPLSVRGGARDLLLRFLSNREDEHKHASPGHHHQSMSSTKMEVNSEHGQVQQLGGNT